jgi:hypothetical protein
MGYIADTIEAMEGLERPNMRRTRWPFTYELFDLDRQFENVQVGWIFSFLGLTVLRIWWPQFHYGTAILTGEVERMIVIKIFDREFAWEK